MCVCCLNIKLIEAHVFFETLFFPSTVYATFLDVIMSGLLNNSNYIQPRTLIAVESKIIFTKTKKNRDHMYIKKRHIPFEN